jgi:hypothetical protein
MNASPWGWVTRTDKSEVPWPSFPTSEGEADAVGVISDNLNIHVPFLEFQSSFGTLSFWADLDYYGTGPNGELLWKLKNAGQN